MRSMAMLCAALVGGMATAAPMPYVESSVPEAVLETGNQARSEALLRWIKAADLAQQVLPGKSALPADFLGRLRMDVQTGGGRVVLRLQGAARPDDRAMFKAVVSRVTRTGAADPRIAAMQLEIAQERLMINRKVVFLGAARGGRMWRGGDDIDMEQYQRQLQDADIRNNPPRLATKPAR